MDPTEPCSACNGSHPSLYEKPRACQQPGTQQRANPEPPGFHVFKDKFDADAFSDWVKDLADDPSKAVSEDDYASTLQFLTRHVLGVLYDETVKSFCILGRDQVKLVKMPEQPLNKPTVIYGLAGTGKTISIMARIQRISSHLKPWSRAIFLTAEKNAIEMVRRKLEACNVDLTHITFDNLVTSPYNLRDITQNEKAVQDLIRDKYRYIYLDSVEDFGVDWVNDLLAKTLTEGRQTQAILTRVTFGSQSTPTKD